METTERCRSLAGEIASYFEEGISLDSHAERYIETCFPDTPFHDLILRICEDPDCDGAPLTELIFFPDLAFQVRLEPLLEKNVFSIEDENRVVGLLLEADIRTTLRKTGSGLPVPVRIPSSVLAPFVRRLKISRRIPQQLIDSVDETIPLEMSGRLKVELRNARFSFSPRANGFLDRFFKGVDPTDDGFHDCLDLVLTLLDERGSESDPYLLLNTRLDTYFRLKQAAAQFMRQLTHSNMETLMHLGIRAPEIGIEEAERKIELLERVIAAMKSGGVPS